MVAMSPRLEAMFQKAGAERVKDAAPLLLSSLQMALATIERLAIRHDALGSVQGTLEIGKEAIAKALGKED